VNGLVALGASHLMPRLRAALPPTVAGVVLCVAGLALTQPALIQATGLSAQTVPDGTSTLIGASSLAVIISLSIWGSTRGKLLALLAGLATGIALAGILGTLPGLDTLAQAPVFGWPALPRPVFGVDPGILLAVAL